MHPVPRPSEMIRTGSVREPNDRIECANECTEVTALLRWMEQASSTGGLDVGHIAPSTSLIEYMIHLGTWANLNGWNAGVRF